MKKCLLFIVLISLAFNSFGQTTVNLKYIRFLHVGISDHMINNPLTISTRPIDRKTVLQRSLSGKSPSHLIGIDVDSLTEKFEVTDSRTYEKILSFVKTSPDLNKVFYTSQRVNDIGSFEIIVDGADKYYLTSGHSTKFFTALILFLKHSYSDPKVIDCLDYQVRTNIPN